MDLRECYETLGGNYDEVKRRLIKDERIQRFLFLFPKDENFALLKKAVEGQDWAAAFRAAHTLKGIAMNLNLDRLSRSAVTLTDLLRNGPPTEDVTPVFTQMEQDYQLTVETITGFQKSLEG